MFLQYFLICYGMAFSSDVNEFWVCSILFFVIVFVVWHHITFRTRPRKSVGRHCQQQF